MGLCARLRRSGGFVLAHQLVVRVFRVIGDVLIRVRGGEAQRVADGVRLYPRSPGR